MTCLFWNVNRQDRCALISSLAAEKHADVVVLAEHAAESEATLEALRGEVDESFVEPPSETPRLQLFARRPSFNLREVYGDASGRLSIRALHFDQREFLFAAAHLVSKPYFSREDQTAETQSLTRTARLTR